MAKIDWETVSSFIEGIGAIDKTITFPKVQDNVKVTNKGNVNVIYTIGTKTGTLAPSDVVEVKENISSFTVRASSGTSEVYVRASEAGTEKEEQANDVMSLLAQKAKQPISKSQEAIIIGCQEDETPTISNATLAMDTTNYKVGSRGYKLTTTGAVTAQLNITPLDVPLKIPNMGVVGLWVYIEDKTKITNIWVSLFGSADSSVNWEVRSDYSESLAEQGGLQNGWNYIRWHAKQSNNTVIHNITNWGNIYKARVMVVTTGATSVTIGKLVGETNKKAQLLFVEDAQYKTFYETAYPTLKARNLPVTWALRISNIGGLVGTSEQITEAEVELLSKENNNSISFHSYDGTNATMTATELRIETMKAIKWLKARGYTGHQWRAAFLQNSAPQSAVIKDLVASYSTSGVGYPQFLLGAFPFLNRYNTPRLAIHGTTKEKITEYFETLKLTKQLFIAYTHGVSDKEGDVTLDVWNHFIMEVDKAISEGWLEGVTYEMLNERYQAYKTN